MRKPAGTEYAPYYDTDISLVPETNVLGVLEQQPRELRDLTATISAEREPFRYEPAKWSIREVVGHIVDTDRVFDHRAFCISRGERQPRPGFDENAYVATSNFDKQPLADLVHELAIVREVNMLALRRFTDTEWDRTGTASGHPVSVRGLAFIMAGHMRHHCNILGERYGISG